MSIFLQLYLDFYEYGNRDELSNFSFTIFTLLDEYKNKTEYHEYDFFFKLKEMATHSSVLAWRIPGTAEPGGLPSMGSQSWTRLTQLSSSIKNFES